MTSFAPPTPPAPSRPSAASAPSVAAAPSTGSPARLDRWYWPIVVGASSIAFAAAFLVFLPDDTADPRPSRGPDPSTQTLPLDPVDVTVPVIAPGELAPSASDADLGPTG